MATVEEQLELLISATTSLTLAVGVQQLSVNSAVGLFDATTNKVNNELNLVDNTADIDKPISSSVQTAIDLKQNILVDGVNISTINGKSILSGTPLVIERGAVEVPALSYDNRDSLRTPILPTPLAGDVVNIPHLGYFQYDTVFEYVDDDETVFEAVDPSDGVTPIGQWVMSIPAFEFTEAQKMFENAVLWEWMEDEQLRFNTY
jgi:hypothetical protein